MEPFRQTLSAFLEVKRRELRTLAENKVGRKKTAGDKGMHEDGEEPNGEPNGEPKKLPLDYATSKTLQSIKEHLTERHKRMKSLKHVKEILL